MRRLHWTKLFSQRECLTAFPNYCCPESCVTKAEEPSLSYYLPIAGGRIIGFILFPRVLVLYEMQSVSSRIWTRVAVCISYDDNHYTMGTSNLYFMLVTLLFSTQHFQGTEIRFAFRFLLSHVLARIYLEFLESGPCKFIILNNSNYFRYIDDILFIYLQELDLVKITDRLNKIEPTIEFTRELKTNNSLPCLDTVLIRNNEN